jgi:hypothetical protein
MGEMSEMIIELILVDSSSSRSFKGRKGNLIDLVTPINSLLILPQPFPSLAPVLSGPRDISLDQLIELHRI